MAPDEQKSTTQNIGGHNFIIGFDNFSWGYAILVPGYKFRECQFKIPAYTCTVVAGAGVVCHMHLKSSCFAFLCDLRFEISVTGNSHWSHGYFTPSWFAFFCE